MEILGREFTGPQKVEYQTLPKAGGIYIVTHIRKDKIKPLYIGFTKDIRHRVQSLLIEGPIPKEELRDE